MVHKQSSAEGTCRCTTHLHGRGELYSSVCMHGHHNARMHVAHFWHTPGRDLSTQLHGGGGGMFPFGGSVLVACSLDDCWVGTSHL